MTNSVLAHERMAYQCVTHTQVNQGTLVRGISRSDTCGTNHQQMEEIYVGQNGSKLV
jgi:hypothetical protein